MTDRSNQRLTWILVVAVVVSTLGVVYASATPDQRIDPYTELYIEGLDGNASDYPDSLAVGEQGTLVVGVSNHENRETTYSIVFQLGDETLGTRTFSVANGETWEHEYSFTPESSGRMRFQVLLYQGDEASTNVEPQTVYLWVTVQES